MIAKTNPVRELEYNRYIQEGNWKCPDSISGAHHWIITKDMRCKHCREVRKTSNLNPVKLYSRKLKNDV